MAIAYVQSAAAANATSTTASTQVVILLSNRTAGNLIFVHIAAQSTTQGATHTITDGDGNTYTQIQAIETNLGGVYRTSSCHYAKNINGGTLTNTITCTFSAVSNYAWIVGAEYSGLDTTSPLHKNAAQRQATPGTGTDGVTSGAQTTTIDGCLVLGGYNDYNDFGSETYTVGTGFTLRQTITVAARAGILEELIQSSAGSVAATMTIGANEDGAMMMAVFIPPSSYNPSRNLNLLGVG